MKQLFFWVVAIALVLVAIAGLYIEEMSKQDALERYYANGVVDADAYSWFSQKLFADDLIMTRDPEVPSDSNRVRYRLETVGQILYGACIVEEPRFSSQDCQIIEELSELSS